jgi:elongation factor 2
MNSASNVRNVSVIGHFGHGKSTVTDLLLSKAGFIPSANNSEIKATDIRRYEQERDITIKSKAFSLYGHLSDIEGVEETSRKSAVKPFLISLIDTPGHVDFSSEVGAALRITDGALVIVDAIENVSIHAETLLRMVLDERVRPIVILNKVDRAFIEFQLSQEELYQSFKRTIETMNVIISTYFDRSMGDVRVYPDKGSVAFGSGLHGWAFTLQQFAYRYSKKFGVDKAKITERFWVG